MKNSRIEERTRRTRREHDAAITRLAKHVAEYRAFNLIVAIRLTGRPLPVRP